MIKEKNEDEDEDEEGKTFFAAWFYITPRILYTLPHDQSWGFGKITTIRMFSTKPRYYG